ncbi:hypothetical protein ABW48_26700, partial [Pluralibacter gergoviae]
MLLIHIFRIKEQAFQRSYRQWISEIYARDGHTIQYVAGLNPGRISVILTPDAKFGVSRITITERCDKNLFATGDVISEDFAPDKNATYGVVMSGTYIPTGLRHRQNTKSDIVQCFSHENALRKENGS